MVTVGTKITYFLLLLVLVSVVTTFLKKRNEISDRRWRHSQTVKVGNQNYMFFLVITGQLQDLIKLLVLISVVTAPPIIRIGFLDIKNGPGAIN